MQEVFDRIVQGLAAQGWKQSLRHGSNACAYRGAEGRKCAIGHVLSAEQAAVAEGYPVAVFIEDYADPLLGFLEVCQLAHDNSSDPAIMKRKFKDVANNFNLSFNA